MHQSNRLKEIFKEQPVVAYRRGLNIKDILVHQKTNNLSTTQEQEECMHATEKDVQCVNML